MNIFDRIKGFFKNKKTKTLSEGQSEQVQYANNNVNSSNKHILQREDGSTLEIEPVLDEMGNQTYKQVYNHKTGELQAIPKFKIMAEELKRIVCQEIIAKEILIDIDPKLLDNPRYADYIANSLLSAKRMEKVIHQYGSYAGTIIDDNGKLKKFKSQGIIDSLNATKEENAKRVEIDRKNAEKRRKNSIRENAAKLESNIKDTSGNFEK